MSQLERIREARTPKNGKAAPKKPAGNLVVYNLTEQDKEFLRNEGLTLEKATEIVERFVSDGHKLSAGSPRDKGGFYAMMRDGGPAWSEAITVSVWAGSLSKALIALGFYLSEVNPDFPSAVQFRLFEDDW